MDIERPEKKSCGLSPQDKDENRKPFIRGREADLGIVKVAPRRRPGGNGPACLTTYSSEHRY